MLTCGRSRCALCSHFDRLTFSQTVRSSSPLPLLVPAMCGGLSLFAAWNAVYAVVLALGPGEK